MSPHEELFRRLLDESSALLAAPEISGIAIPDDELHREIIVPLLPAMLADAAIRKHWSEQAATGFVARLARNLDGAEPAPRWLPSDFEIHVTASYTAGPDAKALADTLLSEESLRDMSAALMNQILDAVWSKLALTAVAEPEAGEALLVEPAPVVPEPVVEVPTALEPEAESLAVCEPFAQVALAVTRPATAARRPVRITRPNPIRGARISRGGLGAPDWSASYPLAGFYGATVM